MTDGGTDGRSGALFLLPVSPRGHGPVAAWISTASWAAAARRRWGAAWVIGPDGEVPLGDVARTGSRPALRARPASGWRRQVPVPVKTAVKDVRRWNAARRFRPGIESGPWADRDLVCVWQRHEPFVNAAVPVAAALDCPSVLFVPAPVAWEAERWGVFRPGWSWLFDRLGERPALRGADVVACGSTVVASVVADHGVDADRIVVTPNGVDMERFAPSPRRDQTRAELGLEDRFVVGWCGSFRGFHALEVLVDAAAEAKEKIPELVLLLVGDGSERPAIAARCAERGVPAVFTGTRPHGEIGELIAAMDVAVVVAGTSDGPYHYSPLKLWEYLACGVATIAPALGDPARRLEDGDQALLVEPGSSGAVASRLCALAEDDAFRAGLGQRARAFAEAELSWDAQVAALGAALGRQRPRPSTAASSSPARWSKVWRASTAARPRSPR